MVIEEPIAADGTAPDPHPPEPGRRDSVMARYLGILSGVFAILYILPLFLVPSGVWDRWNRSMYAQPLNYAFQTAGQNADVVLFGDSTALLGIDPSQMSASLGVKVLNLPNTQASLVVNDDLALRHYLSGNRPPRLIVFYFAPWDFDYGHVDFNTRPLYEGEELLLRQGQSQQVLSFALKHPTEALSFPLRFYATNWRLIQHRLPRPNQEPQLKATLGHMDNIDQSQLTSTCNFPPLVIDNVRFAWVHDLAAKYRSPQTQVMFYAAPVPSCGNVSKVVDRSYDLLPAAPPKQMPPEFFNSQVSYIHPRTFAVSQITRDLTDAARSLLVSSPPNQERGDQ